VSNFGGLPWSGRIRTLHAWARKRACAGFVCIKYPPPPSWPDGRNVGHSTRHLRRVGRSYPELHRNLTGRRILTPSCFRVRTLDFKQSNATEVRRLDF
ncbi:MAG: hypothetical protein IJU61_06630, partial [Victivallales bacterium]|nr:hypothetical protein [Victivallales bacterium]